MLNKLKKAIAERSLFMRVASCASLVIVTAGWLTHATPQFVAVVFTGLALLYLARWRTHIRYYVRDRRCTRRLRRLVWLELGLSVVWLGVGLLAIWLQSDVLLFAGCVIVALGAMLLASEVADALEPTGMDSASRRVELSPFGQRMQLALLRNGLAWCLRFFGNVFPPGRASGFIATVLVLLSLAILRMAGPAANDTVRFVSQFLPKPSGYEKIDDATGHPTATPTSAPAPPASQQPSAVHQPSAVPQPGERRPGAPTYFDLCGEAPTGKPAPPIQARALVAAFLAVGQPASGCAKRPRPVRTIAGKLTGTWTMEGRCGSSLWSLTVANGQGEAAILIGTQPARRARSLARHHELLGASARIPIRSGDGYVLETRSGNEILIRSHGATQPTKGTPSSCGSVPRTGVKYESLPPRLSGLWLALARSDFAWPREILPRTGDARHFVFVSGTVPEQIIATGVCGTDRCGLERTNGAGISSPVEVNATELESLNPLPATAGASPPSG